MEEREKLSLDETQTSVQRFTKHASAAWEGNGVLTFTAEGCSQKKTTMCTNILTSRANHSARNPAQPPLPMRHHTAPQGVSRG